MAAWIWFVSSTMAQWSRCMILALGARGPGFKSPSVFNNQPKFCQGDKMIWETWINHEITSAATQKLLLNGLTRIRTWVNAATTHLSFPHSSQVWSRAKTFVPRGLTARISGFHKGGPGSNPGVGILFYVELFFVCHLLFVVCCLLFVICCLLLTVCCLSFVICFKLSFIFHIYEKMFAQKIVCPKFCLTK